MININDITEEHIDKWMSQRLIAHNMTNLTISRRVDKETGVHYTSVSGNKCRVYIPTCRTVKDLLKEVI